MFLMIESPIITIGLMGSCYIKVYCSRCFVDLHSFPGHLDPGDSRLARQYDVNFARCLSVVVDVVKVLKPLPNLRVENRDSIPSLRSIQAIKVL